MILTLEELDGPDWPEVVSQFDDFSYEQSRGYAAAAAARHGATVVFVKITDGRDLLACAAVRLKLVPGLARGIAYASGAPMFCRSDRGPLACEELGAVLGALREHFVEGKGHILRVRLPVVCGLDPTSVETVMARCGYAPTAEARRYATILIDLSLSEDDLLGNMNKKWRYELKRSRNVGLEIEIGDARSHGDRLVSLYETVARAKGFASDVGPEFVFGIDDPAYHRDIIIARHDGADVGAISLARTGRLAIYQFGATVGEGRALNAGYALAWSAMRFARENGIRWYDLGGIDPEQNPDVYRFKKRMGGVEVAATPFQAAGAGLVPSVIGGAERLFRAVLKGKRIIAIRS